MAHDNYIYHYTSKESLKKILESKKLKLSSCRNYKDSQAESDHLKNIISDNLNNEKFKTSICNFIEKHQKKRLTNDEEIIEEIFNIRANSYMACFSKVFDNQYLWQKYAENHGGVVLAFAKKYIIPSTEGVTMSGPDGRSTELRWIENMLYGEKQFIESIIAWSQPHATLVFDIDAFKNECYKKEQECRLLAYCPHNPPKTHHLHLDQKNSNGEDIIRHFTLEKGDLYLQISSDYQQLANIDNSIAIESIFCKHDETAQFVKKLLEDKGLKREIFVRKMGLHTLKQIETPRLIIRPVQLGDEIQLNQAVNNSLESLQQWMPWANDPSLKTTRDFIQKGVFAKSSQSIADFPMVVIHKEDQKIISGSGYNDRSEPKNGLYEIGYWCDVDYQGKGYVTEYVNALTKYALEELKAKIVVIRMEVDNSKSIAIAERLNFKNQGTKPSVTKDNATDYYFTCESIELLPPLDSSWSYEENNSSDAKIIAWARNALKISDDRVFAESKMLLKTPWSSVMAVNTAAGTVYLKHMPEKIALEADIIKYLKNKFNASVPEVIADNKELNCFLMKDAGVSLRSILKKKFNVDLMCEAINQFTKLQISIGNNVEGLLELGVPDWRVDKLAVLFANLLEQKDLLISDGLSEDEISQLKSLLPKITLMCEKLSSFAIHDTLVQCDFHDNNILFDKNTDSFTYIDLGEVVISHPFFSLAGCLWQMHKHYDVKEPDANFQKIQASCFNNFIAINTEENVIEAFKISKLFWYVYEVLAQYRLIQACDREKIMAFQHGKLSKTLIDFIVEFARSNILKHM